MFDFGKSGKFSGHGVKCHKNVYFVTSRDRYKFYDIKETVSFYELSRNYVFFFALCDFKCVNHEVLRSWGKNHRK